MSLTLPRPAALGGFRPLVWLLGLAALRRQRRALAEMEPHRLADLGLTPDQARAEAVRPLWNAPDHWLR